MNKKNKFLIFRNWLEHKISNKLKKISGNDLYDWIALLILFFLPTLLLVYCFYKGIISIETTISGIIFWFTAFVILRYTKETYYLKKLAQKQNITDIRPYLRLQWIYPDNPLPVLVNVGKGVAKNVIIQEIDYHILLEKFKFKNIPAMSPGGSTELVLDENNSTSKNVDHIRPVLGGAKYQINIGFKDIENRKYYAIFESDDSYNDCYKIVKQKGNN